MKKIFSGILYAIFFGFAGILFISCIILIINTVKRNNTVHKQFEAIVIDEEGEGDKARYETINAEVSSETLSEYAAVDMKYGYDILDSESKRYLYDKIDENIYSVSDKKDDNGHYRIARLRISGERLSEFDIREVVNAYIYDNPQIFWLENLFGYAYVGDDTITEFYSVISADECEDCIELFNKKLGEMISGINSGLSEYEREKILHDRLLKKCRYKNGIESSKDGWQYFSAYGAIVTGEAVCEGYAKSMQILLSKAGIPCLTVKGEGDGIFHMWNVVELEDNWYHVDPTWDDNEKDGIIYEYFNLDSNNINKNHKISEDIKTVLSVENSTDINTNARYNFFVPLCTSMNMNYYNTEGVTIDEFDKETDSRVIKAMVERAERGENYFPLKFGQSMKYSDYINKLFYASPYKYYYYIDHANEKLDNSHKISRDNISVLKNEDNMTLRVKIVFEENKNIDKS